MIIGKFFPLILVVIGNITYHLSSKNLPKSASPLVGLTVTYLTALLLCLIGLFCTQTNSIKNELTKLNFSSWLSGLAVLGVEGGYLLLYRSGWNISKGSLIANIITASALLLIGFYIYKEN
ncbi:hypothetical protein [Candidatus Avelusimicrobium stercoris]|uniref:hypothetical protein n=1 Tax=Candidatus Avelusimicrobium stercoris TaxID=1947924 RepID=UPI003D11AF0F